MPWGDSDNSNNKKPGKKPSPWWEGEDGNKPSNDMDIEDLLKKGQGAFKKIMGGGNSPGNNNSMAVTIVIIAVLFWLATGVYTVDEGEEAVVMRFGKVVRIGETGLNYRLPSPIESTIKEQVKKVRKIEVGFRSNTSSPYRGRNVRAASSDLQQESLMLTGDENILSVHFVVQWSISNLQNYIFNVKDPGDTVKNAAVSAMREVIGNTDMVSAQTSGRFAVQNEAMDIAQKILNSYKTGVEISLLQLQGVEPPNEVIEAFRDVQTAKADKERLINQSQSYQNDILPRARGEASQLIQDSEAYKKEVVAEAEGRTNRFNSIYNQYKKAKVVTRKRIYIETMEEILEGVDKIILDNKGSSNVVPYLALPKIAKDK